MATAIVCHDPEVMLGEKQHLAVPHVGVRGIRARA
jgi:hypothetical protein